MRRTTAAASSAIFFVLAPGVVAGLVPWWLTGWQPGDLGPYPAVPRILGGLLLVAGVGVLLHAFARFVREGAGTPAPVAPTQHLVVGGLYRYVRNPMYVAVLSTIVGQALLLGRPVLLAYAALAGLAMVTFVKLYEEPVLQRHYGEQYAAYRRAVPGWWPRLRPWRPQT